MNERTKQDWRLMSGRMFLGLLSALAILVGLAAGIWIAR